ncbi:MAG: fasciclin domain-containing protein, partial [Bacteroidota bacterium]
QILLYHVLGTQVLSTDLSDGLTATTLQGDDVTVTINDDGIFINDAEVIVADITTDNGVVHVIDAVLLPPPALPATVVDIIVESEIHNTLEAAVIAAELADDLSGEGPFTVFAPTDDAFAALPEGTVETLLEDPTGDLAQILLYHVLGTQVLSTDLSDGLTATTLQGDDVTVTINDDGIFINDAEVIVADILAENGVVHVIDAVLLPPPALPATVVDIIVESEIHTTLEVGVIAAGLADDLSGEGPFTVFAPTDDAFAALPDGVLDSLLADPNDLGEVLLYHVLNARVLSTDLSDGQTATTLLGEDITVTIDADGNIFINDAQVITADILAENGVVHVIDAVLTPPAEVDCEDVVGGGTVALEDGTTEATVTVGDGIDDILSFTSSDAFGENFTYVVTDDNNVILGIPPGNSQNFEGAGPGVCRVWGLSYTGNLTAMAGDTASAIALSDDCFDLSDNFITVIREEADLPATVVDIIVNSPIHNTLEAAVIAAELADDLSGEGPFTVFAPTDDAFAALPEGVLDALLEGPTSDLANILLYHVLNARVLSSDLSDGQTATTLLGEDITVTIDADGNIFINDAQVTAADILADNGVVHVIDAVLLPPAPPTTVVDIIVNSDIHNTLEAAVIAAELADDLSGEGPFTVFAPTDDAFAALPEGTVETLLEDPTGDLAQILLYHVLGAEVLSTDLSDGLTATTLQGDDITVTINDDGIFINDAEVIVADLQADNGVVHVIDAVLLPTVTETTTVVDIIVNSDIHNTLEAAVIAAELADDLSGEGPFTVFAPTDDAFAALPEGTVETLLEDPTGDLAQILLYHVLGAEVLSSDLSDGQTATTLQGQDITVSIDTAGNIFINDAQVIVADIQADNGVVHVIDAVLLPELDDPSDRFLEIRPPSRVVDQNAGETVFVVFTNTTWSIDTEGLDNIQIFPSSGSGTAFIKVFYDENMEGPARTTVLDIVATTGETGTFTLTQAGTDDFIAATPDAIEVNAVEGSTSFELISNADWTVSTAADWITLSTADGSGNATIGVDYASNSAIEGRTATITAMTADGAMATVTVTQGASADVEVFFELRPPSLEVGSGSGEGQFVIFTNAIWGISTDADWVEFFGKEGEGTAFIKVFYDANDSSESRTAELNVVTSTGESGVFTLTQAGAGNFIITNPDFTSPDAFTMDMTLFPNPTTTELNIRVEASDDRSVDVQIIDTNGRIVKLFNSQAIFEGINTLQVPTADLTNGIYYFRMIGQDVVKEARFMVAK